ncbi:hypothetical protein V7S43_014525 [Phytophthora oleae]|uniref:Uncharacterized protein n=1 Tax=Phytophthora oleae TaxID=2107226 RepID=A0ABD3F1K8_9STRA
MEAVCVEDEVVEQHGAVKKAVVCGVPVVVSRSSRARRWAWKRRSRRITAPAAEQRDDRLSVSAWVVAVLGRANWKMNWNGSLEVGSFWRRTVGELEQFGANAITRQNKVQMS